MTLPVADIDRWNAESVRAVFHAADARGHTTLEASRQLGTLSVFDTWEGATAEARVHIESLALGRDAEAASDAIVLYVRTFSDARGRAEAWGRFIATGPQGTMFDVARVERITQAVADEVHTEDRQGQEHTGHDGK